MEARVQKAFEFASECSKQLLTLSTGIITITITFSKDVLQGVPDRAVLLLMIAWGVYLFSMVCGVWSLLALTGTLEPAVKEAGQPSAPSIRGPNVRIPAALQILSFLIATGLVIAFAIISTMKASHADTSAVGECGI